MNADPVLRIAWAAMQADLVLEGGGVKGIGLVGAVSLLEERGYEFRRVAGTSAGAIVGSLVAAGMPAGKMRELLASIDYTRFEDPSLLQRFPLIGPPLSLLFENGLYRGAYLKEWLSGRLADLGVRTFGDLRLPDGESPWLPDEQRYRLVVMAADVSEGRLVRLPWDLKRLYDIDPDTLPVVDAVRASMSIPFFFEPVKLGGSLLVDGGVLSDFPIDALNRTDGKRPRWPTFGVKLSARPGANLRPLARAGPLGLGLAVVATMANAHDQMHLDDPCVLRRTMFVDTDHVNPVDFHIGPEAQESLYEHGRAAAEAFLAGWDWDAYLGTCRSGQ